MGRVSVRVGVRVVVGAMVSVGIRVGVGVMVSLGVGVRIGVRALTITQKTWEWRTRTFPVAVSRA